MFQNQLKFAIKYVNNERLGGVPNYIPLPKIRPFLKSNKTMADKLMYISNDDTHKTTPYVNYN